MKSHLLSYPYLVKKTSILSKLLYITGKKSKYDAFFPPFIYEKTATLMTIFCQKNVHSKKHTFLIPILCQKTSTLSKTPSSQVIFFQIFHVKHNAVMPIFGHNNVNSVTTTLYYGPKNSIGYPSFRFFTKKSLLSCPYFAKKTPIL